jgi:hypothetical protein
LRIGLVSGLRDGLWRVAGLSLARGVGLLRGLLCGLRRPGLVERAAYGIGEFGGRVGLGRIGPGGGNRFVGGSVQRPVRRTLWRPVRHGGGLGMRSARCVPRVAAGRTAEALALGPLLA